MHRPVLLHNCISRCRCQDHKERGEQKSGRSAGRLDRRKDGENKKQQRCRVDGEGSGPEEFPVEAARNQRRRQVEENECGEKGKNEGPCRAGLMRDIDPGCEHHERGNSAEKMKDFRSARNRDGKESHIDEEEETEQNSVMEAVARNRRQIQRKEHGQRGAQIGALSVQRLPSSLALFVSFFSESEGSKGQDRKNQKDPDCKGQLS